MSYPFILQGSNLTVVIGTTSHTINKTSITYQKVLDAIKANDWDTVKEVIEPTKMIVNYSQGNVTIKDDTLFWGNTEMHSALSSRMIQMVNEGFDITPMTNFMHNLMKNPSKRSVTELYGFLEKNNLPITPDGYFLAYKKVRQNYFDVHSGTMDNSVGNVVEMPRNEVDDDKDRTCSSGLHFCSKDYLSHFGGERIVIVKINPADVVSIPSDYNDSKGRACRYEVIGEVDNTEGSTTGAFTKSVQANAVNAIKVAPAKVAPVKAGPKTGSTPFYQGYTFGYEGKRHGPLLSSMNYNDHNNYMEGVAKGNSDRINIKDKRYQYVAPVVAAPVATGVVKGTAAWAQAGMVKQEYDRFGRPLSMTKDAIRKREARKAQKANQPKMAAWSGIWPQPKV